MSICKTIAFTCPTCAAKTDITVWKTVNTDLRDSLPQEIISGKFFEVKCSGCGKIAPVVYSMLYNDLRHNTWIYMILPSDKDYSKKISDLQSKALPLSIESRLVDSPSALAEKISILEAGRNDRYIEFYKAFILVDLLKEHPELPYDSIEIEYIWENLSEHFIVYSNGNEVCCAAFDENIYQYIAKEHSEALCNTSDSSFFVCDINWALSHAESVAKKTNSNIDDSDVPVSDTPENKVSEVDKSIEEIGFCRKCGRKIPSDSEFCSYCGVPVVRADASGVFFSSENLNENKSKKPKELKKEKSVKQKQAKQKKHSEKKHSSMPTFVRVLLFFAFLMILSCGILYYLFEYVVSVPSSNGTDRTTITTTTTTRELVPVPVQSGAIIKSPSTSRLIEFEVSVPFGSNYYIYMEGNHSADTMSFYLKGGETSVVKVPIGVYTVYYACGDTWYGTGYLFGEDTMYYKCDDTFEFTTEYGWSLTLKSVYNGNLDTDIIDADEFPG